MIRHERHSIHRLWLRLRWLLLGGRQRAPRQMRRWPTPPRSKDSDAIRALLEKKADVNAPQADGMTALHWAAHHDDLDAVKRLIAAGADAKAANRYGVTPLVARLHQRQHGDRRAAARRRGRPE